MNEPDKGVVMMAYRGKIPVGIVFWGTALLAGLDQVGGKRAIGWGSYVKPEHRKSQICTELRAAARAHLKEQGFKKLDGSVDPTNQAAVKSVEAAGFRHTTLNVELDL
jgi:RimJ/RimL family protein N-acetyltransferase